MKKQIRRIAKQAMIPAISILTLLTLISINSWAGPGKKAKAVANVETTKSENSNVRKLATENLGEAGQLLANYLGCARPLRQDSDVEALRTCVLPHLYGRNEKARQDRFISWLILNPQIEEIRRCGADDLQAADYFPERTFNHLCFQFKLNGISRVAVAFFKGAGKSKDKLGLYSFFY